MVYHQYMLQTWVKTTVLLPSDLLHKAKLKAVYEKTTVAKMIRESLSDRVEFKGAKVHVAVSDPLRHLGAFHCGIVAPYRKRSDLYEKRI